MKRATINDVAREAGVSRQTVSRAINDKDEISPETRERVMQAVEKLGYRPNRLAQGMVTQRTRTVGLEVASITNPFFAEVVQGAQAAAAEHEYNLILVNSEDDLVRAREVLSTLVAQGVDGLISFLIASREGDILSLADSGLPVVLLNAEYDHPNVSRVYVDIYHGAQVAVEYLIERGHTRIGMVTNGRPAGADIRRFYGYKDTLAAHGIQPEETWIQGGTPTLTGGYEAASRLLAAAPQLTAIFAYNDLMATGALRACRDAGRRVPETCAVVGFDDINLAAMVSPSLTTISFDKYAMGWEAVMRLLQMLEAPDATYEPVHLDIALVKRESA